MYHRLNAESLGDPRIQLLCQENAACTPETNHASNQHTTLLILKNTQHCFLKHLSLFVSPNQQLNSRERPAR
jgi:hypothetical protein